MGRKQPLPSSPQPRLSRRTRLRAAPPPGHQRPPVRFPLQSLHLIGSRRGLLEVFWDERQVTPQGVPSATARRHFVAKRVRRHVLGQAFTR
jgi:hypothetical protein